MTQGSDKAHTRSESLITADILASLMAAMEEEGATNSILKEMRAVEPQLLDALKEEFVQAVGRAAVHAEGMSPRMLAAFHAEHARAACFVFAAMRKAWSNDLTL